MDNWEHFIFKKRQSHPLQVLLAISGNL